jgi:hypothetical protein
MSAAVGGTCLVLFSLLRHSFRPYKARLLSEEVTFKPPEVPGFGRGVSFVWNWAIHVVRVSERALYDSAGLDALYYDRANRLSLLVAFFVAILNVGVVLPVNFLLGTVIDSTEALQVGGMSLLDRLSMTNVPAASPLLWIHTVVVLLTVLFVSFLLWVHFENFRADRQAFLGHLVVDSDRLFRTSSSESSSLADEEDPETSVNDAEHEKRLANRTLSGASSYSVTPTLRRAASLLRRRFSVHVREHETGISAAASGVVSPDVSEVHSPLSVFHRQHVSIADVTGPNATSLAVKAQQYAVLVTNVDPTSPSIRNPEGSLPANRAAELEVSRAFASLFPDFVAAVPAQWHARVDKRLCELDRKQLALMRVHERIQTCAANDKAAKLLERRDALERETKRLAAEIAREKEEAQTDPRSAFSFFVLFKSQTSAAIAAQTLIQEPGGDLAWTVRAAPAPDDVAYSSLWKTPSERWARSFVAKLAVAGIVVFPIGVFTSSMLSLSASLCGKNRTGYYWSWYCENQSDDGPTFFFRLLTAWMPSLLLATWNAVVVPYGFAYLALFECAEPTLSGIDRKVFKCFYFYACLNVLLGGMLAGTLFSQLENIIKSPSSVFVLLGHAVPQSSNFFLAYVSTNALMLEPLRLLIPHTGVLKYLVSGRGERTRCCGRIARDRKASWAPRSLRLGAHYGAQQLILLVCLVFSTASPLITAASLLFFAINFVVWRHHLLYVFVRSYESGAMMFPVLFSRIINSLFMYQVFMAAYLLIKQAYTQAFLLWILVPPFLFQFQSLCLARFVTKSTYLPLSIAAEMPAAAIPADAFVAPQMREGFKGWGAQVGKVWQGYGGFVAKFA